MEPKTLVIRVLGGRKEDAANQARQALLFYQFGGPLALFLLPFVLKTLLYYPDRLLIALAALVLVALTGINAVFAFWKGTLPVPSVLVAIATAISVGMATWMLGLEGMVWTYPALAMLHFLLDRRPALVINGLLLVGTVVLIYPHSSAEVTGRVAVSMLALIVFLNLFTNVVEYLQDALREAAVTDFLTGAYNRRHLDKVIGETLERRRRHGVNAALLMIDIDHFKRVNDELGHEAGDTVLRATADIVRKNIRKLDALFRIGGEEFLVLLPNTDHASACGVAEKLRASIASASICPGGRKITVSIGASALVDGESLDQWMRRCDKALYRAKAEGRNRVVAAEHAADQT